MAKSQNLELLRTILKEPWPFHTVQCLLQLFQAEISFTHSTMLVETLA